MERNVMNVTAAKQIDMVDYLATLGFRPTTIKGNSYWYLSPLHNEKTPSFKIDRKLNRWYDHGEGKGGNLVDFGIAYFQCDVRTLLQRLGTDRMPALLPIPTPVFRPLEEDDDKITVLQVKPLTSRALFAYLYNRGIAPDIAKQYCVEVAYEFKGRPYYAIGFKNNAGGYELRNAYAKLSSSPKGLTTILNGHQSIAVFEGFSDFLSYRCAQQQMGWKDQDYLILNSTSFLKQSKPILAAYSEKWLFLDNDETGRKCSRALASSGTGYVDMAPVYKDSKDLNEWLVSTRLSKAPKLPDPQKLQQGKKLKR